MLSTPTHFSWLTFTSNSQGDGDSEIALVVEDDDMLESTMDGKPYMAARFAATLRRQLYKEHLGLIPPQTVDSRHEHVTAAMRAAPIANADETQSNADAAVMDPLVGETVDLWERTAKENRNIFTEVFRPVPSNLVRDWKAYDVRYDFCQSKSALLHDLRMVILR